MRYQGNSDLYLQGYSFDEEEPEGDGEEPVGGLPSEETEELEEEEI